MRLVQVCRGLRNGRRLVFPVLFVILIIGLLPSCNFPSSRTPPVNPTFVAVMTAAYQINTPTAGLPLTSGSPNPPGQLFTPQPGATIPPLATSVFPSPVSATPTTASTLSAIPGTWTALPAGKIVFTCYVENVDQICLMGANGSNVVRLTDSGATDFYPSLSPDGSQVIFSSHREGGPFQIFKMKTDGTGLEKLTGTPEGNLYAPAFSPNGQQIVFTDEAGRKPTIWIIDADGSEAYPVDSSGENGLDPIWSPDGTQIAFASDRDGSLQLYIINADGTGLKQVTRDIPEMGGRSSWSPDGKSLAFYAGPTGNHNIYLIDVDGNNLRQLTAGGDNLAPSFSPDGQWIAFTSYRAGNNEIFIMRPDGSEVTRVTNLRRPDWQPRWGP